ncbi:MAG: hypothetical protein CL582_16725 [Alteromonadaceae bacterium]|nr:hypothetical protein [Alteromonadaceae bacterium]|tara:strand:- start:1442 stop:1996 length:555 start_codon:yes stop_codon:yes gene_type:complete
MEALESGDSSLMLSVEELDMPSNVEGIVTTLRRVLSKPYVQSISLRTGRPIEVTWYKSISDSLDVGEPEEDPDMVLSRVELEEFSTTKSPKETLVDAMVFLSQRNLYANHLFVGSLSYFRDWVDLPSVVPLPRQESVDGRMYYNFVGLNLFEVESLGEDVVVLLGSESRNGTTTETKYGLKIVT